jgi:hypothetical protein
VLLNEGKGTLEDRIWTSLSVSPGCSVSGDFNGDGKPDLALNTAEGITILLGTGKESAPFSLGSTIPIANTLCLRGIGDLNGDGILDLAVATSTSVVTLLGNGDGTFTQKSSLPTPVGAGYIVLADFNHDGKLDFATSSNLIALGNGDGTFQTPTNVAAVVPPGGFTYVATGDINNDGWPDLVFSVDEQAASAYVLLNNHTGGFTQVPTNYGGLTNEAVLADLNGDGNLDLILSYSVYLGNGQGDFTFDTELSFDTGAQFGFNIVADVNGDGIPDVEFLSANTVAIFLGKGDGTFETPYFLGGGQSPGDLLAVNAHGQAAGAGKPDLLLPDETGGILTLFNLTK